VKTGFAKLTSGCRKIIFYLFLFHYGDEFTKVGNISKILRSVLFSYSFNFFMAPLTLSFLVRVLI